MHSTARSRKMFIQITVKWKYKLESTFLLNFIYKLSLFFREDHFLKKKRKIQEVKQEKLEKKQVCHCMFYEYISNVVLSLFYLLVIRDSCHF